MAADLRGVSVGYEDERVDRPKDAARGNQGHIPPAKILFQTPFSDKPTEEGERQARIHEGKVSKPTGRHVAGHHSGLKRKSPGSAHGVQQGPFPVVARKEQCRRGDGLTYWGLRRVGLDASTMEEITTAVNREAKEILVKPNEDKG